MKLLESVAKKVLGEQAELRKREAKSFATDLELQRIRYDELKAKKNREIVEIQAQFESQIQELSSLFKSEKDKLLTRITELEAELNRCKSDGFDKVTESIIIEAKRSVARHINGTDDLKWLEASLDKIEGPPKKSEKGGTKMDDAK